jgi:hypothetical protein
MEAKPMTTTTTFEQELRQLEQRYWDAMKEKDVQAIEELTDFPCLITGAQGVAAVDRQTFAKMLRDSSWIIEDATLSDIQVRRVSDDVAVVAYKLREQLQLEGKPVTLEAADSSTWIRRDGSWACAAHTESILGDRYGRDRRPK